MTVVITYEGLQDMLRRAVAEVDKLCDQRIELNHRVLCLTTERDEARAELAKVTAERDGYRAERDVARAEHVRDERGES